MLINATKSRLVIGRFSILPGEKVPAFQLTGEEAAAVDKFKSAGRLVEKPASAPAATPQPESEKVEEPVQETPQTERSAARRQKAKVAPRPASEDMAASTDTVEEQVSRPAGE